ncbi:hypothetical protein C5Y93_01835 [Blastopirellula marina]|uniref:Uncharacterized protein n=1 Tax=Blastopirellula marina TaxID=124 RepID=A0A2S8GTQ0_9BACT|nr:hypothetical protein C5Y93_01835 [Blastopirellula marina]
MRIPFLAESLWVDELHTAWVVADGISDIPQRAAMGNQSPLYFFGVWAWVQVVGLDEWSLRLPSVIASALSVGVVTAIAYRWTLNIWAAAGIGLIAAMDYDAIFYGTEARTYALVQLVAVLQVVSAWHMTRGEHPKYGFAWCVLSLVNFYLHYSTMLFSGCLALVMLTFCTTRQARVQLLIAGGGIAVGLLVSLPHLAAIFARRGNWAHFVSAFSNNEWTRWGTLLAVLLPAVIALLACWWRKVPTESIERRRFYFLTAVVLLPIAVAWTTTATGIAALFLGRFLFSSEATLPLLLAAMLAIVPPGWLSRGAILAAVLVAGYLRLPQNWETMRGEDWRSVTEAASARIETMRSPPAVLVAAGLIETDILRTPTASEPWEAFARLPIETIYALPPEVTERFGLTHTQTGQPTPRYMSESDPFDTVVLIVRGDAARADQVAETFMRSFTDHVYEVETPEDQAQYVQWRILVPQFPILVPPDD